MKQPSTHTKTKTLPRTKTGREKRLGDHGLAESSTLESARVRSPKSDHSDQDQIMTLELDLNRIEKLPKEVGVMLITAGIVGLILPGPGTPAIIAGGLALWPNAFGKLESWLERRHPRVHRESMKQISRFLNDLEKRYPYTDSE
jgi:Putative transmembrane protein (PGPGW)